MAQNNNSTLLIPALRGIYDGLDGLAYAALRLCAGAFLMPHGAQKLFGSFGGDPAKTAGFFSAIGIEPAATMVTVVGAIEFFGGLLLALGLLTRPVAVAGAVMLVVAALKVHLSKGFFWTGGGVEYPLLWAMILVFFAVRGGGAFSVDRALGREI